MRLVRPLAISLAIVAAMTAASVWAWPRLGETPMPIHYGLHGPDGFAPASVALWVLPGVALTLSLLLGVMPGVMPKKGRLERSAVGYQSVWLAVVALLAVSHGVGIASALGAPVNAARLVAIAAGVILVVFGNVMGKLRYNFVVGVRNPWTLASERVWDQTHRFLGPWFVGWGVLVAAVGLIVPSPLAGVDPATVVIIAGALVVTVLSLVYAYLAARRSGAA